MLFACEVEQYDVKWKCVMIWSCYMANCGYDVVAKNI